MGRNDHQRTCGSSTLHALSWIPVELWLSRAFMTTFLPLHLWLPRLNICLLLPRHFLELDLLCSCATTGEQSIGHMIVAKFSLCLSQASFTFSTNEIAVFQSAPRFAYYYFLSNLLTLARDHNPERTFTMVLDHTWKLDCKMSCLDYASNPCRNPRS